jgi:hypothetical protein
MFRTLSAAAPIGLMIGLTVGLMSLVASAEQLSADPFTPIEASQDVIGVSYIEFATIPDADGGEAPRLMHMLDEAGTKRLFVSTMRGMLYSVGYDGKDVTPYLDINAANWGVGVQFSGSERGVQSFAFHPDFGKKGAPGYGKFYTYVDTTNVTAKADFTTPGTNRSHDTVLLEWTAKNATAKTYDGAAPKEVFRAAQPFPNHNGGQIGFNTNAKSGTADYGLLYVGLADGGAGGDPLKVAPNMNNMFGKILRIDPLGSNSTNGKYGIPTANPFVKTANALPEIYASGVRNPQRFTWDSKDSRMYLAEIGQNQVEEITEVTAGADLGWSVWEGSYKYTSRQVDLDNPRSDSKLAWPIVEYDHKDPLLQRLVAITGITVYRSDEIKSLQNLMIFGDNPSGEIFYINADKQPNGGHSAIRRVLLKDGDTQKTLMDVIRAKNAAQGKSAPTRVDLRFGFGADGRIFLLNKRDGVIRLLVPDGTR